MRRKIDLHHPEIATHSNNRDTISLHWTAPFSITTIDPRTPALTSTIPSSLSRDGADFVLEFKVDAAPDTGSSTQYQITFASASSGPVGGDGGDNGITDDPPSVPPPNTVVVDGPTKTGPSSGQLGEGATLTTSPFYFEYVTSAVSVLNGDGIVVHVVNDDSLSAETQVEIYQNTGPGAVLATDSGLVGLIPTWTWGLGYTVSSSGEYWLRIRASSEFLIPKASFERDVAGIFVPVVSYRPGDFAVFELQPVRRRLW